MVLAYILTNRSPSISYLKSLTKWWKWLLRRYPLLSPPRLPPGWGVATCGCCSASGVGRVAGRAGPPAVYIQPCAWGRPTGPMALGATGLQPSHLFTSRPRDEARGRLVLRLLCGFRVCWYICYLYQLQVIRRVIRRVTSCHLSVAADSKTSPRNPVMCIVLHLENIAMPSKGYKELCIVLDIWTPDFCDPLCSDIKGLSSDV